MYFSFYVAFFTCRNEQDWWHHMEEEVLMYYSFVCRVSHGEVMQSSDMVVFFFCFFFPPASSSLLKGDATEFKPHYSGTKRDVRLDLVRGDILAQRGSERIQYSRKKMTLLTVALDFSLCCENMLEHKWEILNKWVLTPSLHCVKLSFLSDKFVAVTLHHKNKRGGSHGS